jgi:flagellar motor switch protein FliN
VTETETNITADHEATRLIDTQIWLLKEFATGLAAAFEGAPGGGAKVTTSATDGPPGDPRLPWRQPLLRLPGAMWIVADETSWHAIGASVLRAAEIEETADQLRSEYLEVIRQAVSRVASAMTARLDVEIIPAGGEQTDPVRELAWGALEVKLTDTVATIAVAFEAEMLFALTTPVSHELPRTESVSAKFPKDSKTYDLLLDLELPVSISFGRANVPLKDVLKFTVGSIVELNRAIGDPVEVIVNNCVIARGQVVVVEGNFGVRILNVISTQERLRSLD